MSSQAQDWKSAWMPVMSLHDSVMETTAQMFVVGLLLHFKILLLKYKILHFKIKWNETFDVWPYKICKWLNLVLFACYVMARLFWSWLLKGFIKIQWIRTVQLKYCFNLIVLTQLYKRTLNFVCLLPFLKYSSHLKQLTSNGLQTKQGYTTSSGSLSVIL